MHWIHVGNRRINESRNQKITLLLGALVLSVCQVQAQTLECGATAIESTARWNEECIPGFPSNCQTCIGSSQGDPLQFALESNSLVTFNIQNLSRYQLDLLVTGGGENHTTYYKRLHSSLVFTLDLQPGVYTLTGDSDLFTTCGSGGPGIYSASITCQPSEGPSTNPAVVLNTLDGRFWKTGTVPEVFDAPAFSETNPGLSMEVVPGKQANTFGFWETAILMAPLASGYHRLKLDILPSGDGSGPPPDIRLRVFDATGLNQSIRSAATSGDLTLPTEVEVVFRSDGSTQWGVAVDLLSFDASKANGVIIRSFTLDRVTLSSSPEGG